METKGQEKDTGKEQEDHARDERSRELVSCVNCVHILSSLYCVFFIVIGCVTTKILTTGRVT